MSVEWSVRWFAVTLDGRSFSLQASPPGGEPWQAVIPWDSVARVCFEAAGPMASDSLYVFTSLRPESWVIPVEAVQAHHGFFCWPPGESDSS